MTPTGQSDRADATAVAGRRTPSATAPHLVGRTRELADLSAAVAGAEAGKGSTVVLTGESGIGKTRLATAVMDQAMRRNFTVAVGRAYPVETGVPYAVFADAMLPVLRAIEPGALTLLTRGGVAELVQLFPALAVDDERARGPSSRGDPAELKARLLWNFAQFLSRLAAKRPLLIVLENLQWADSASLELLHFASRQIGGDRILIVGTLNDTDPRAVDPQAPARVTLRSLADAGAARIVALEPLDADSTRELVERSLSGNVPMDAALPALVYDRTRGNPFFVEETIKSLVGTGGAGAIPDAERLSALTLPRTIREAVAARLTTLSPDARRLADLVAVIGTRASHDALAHVAATPDAPLLAALDELRQARVLSERSERGDIVYDFTHPLVQETLYAELGLARARGLHAVVANALESFHGARAGDHADELATHYLRADTRALDDKAVQYLHSAGTLAMAKHANREAANYLAAALDIAARDDASASGPSSSNRANGDGPPSGNDANGRGGAAEARRRDIEQDLARAYQRLGEYDAALSLWTRAAAAAEAAGDHRRLATIERNLGMVCFWSGRHDAALAHYGRASAAAVAASAPLVEARILIARAMCLQGLGRRDEAESAVRDALAIAERTGDVGLLARAHRALLLLYVWTGPPDEARTHGAKAIALAEQSGQAGVAWSAHWALAMLAGLTAHAADVGVHLAEAERLADELRSPLLRVWTAEVAIEYYAGIGDWDRAVALAERTVEVARALGQRTLVPRVLVWLGLLYFGRGEVERGKACVDEAWVLSKADGDDDRALIGEVHTVVPSHTGRAAYHLVMQEYEAAIEVGERGLAIADASGYVVWAVHRLMPVIAEAALWKSDMPRARTLALRMRRDAERLDHRLGLAWADACDALVELLKGDKHRSVAELRSVAERLEAVPYVLDAARVRRQLGRALAETGDREGATRELRRAHEVFARIGAEPELNATREQLRALGARPPVRAVSEGAAGLTGRELEIVQLVSARRSNKEIGSALDISSRTVSTHLSNIFAKLGVGSRGELADYARKAGLAEVE